MSNTWKDKLNKDKKIDFSNFYIHQSWKELFTELYDELEVVQDKLTERIKEGAQIYPNPDDIFNAFNFTPLNKIKVVILGQDPYHQSEVHGNQTIPQASGLSFSVPKEFKIPSSLNNMYKNLKNNNQLEWIPTHGCLESWAYQGCLMLNTALTVEHGDANCHKDLWEKINRRIIKYISDRTNKVVFVLWGGYALKNKRLIDTNKHKIIASSHPSGLSCNSKLGLYPSFNKQDHFGIINWHLKNLGKDKIIWQIT